MVSIKVHTFTLKRCVSVLAWARKAGHIAQRGVVAGLICALTGLPGYSVANGFESLDNIKSAVRHFLTQNLQQRGIGDFHVHVDRLDSRLRLAACSSKLQAFLPTSTRLVGNVTIGVQCATGKGWTVYVPAQIDVYEDILTSARPLLRGQRIAAHDIQVSHRKASKLSVSYFHQPSEIIGMVAKRGIPAGRPFSLQLIAPPRLVRRGQDVTLIAETGVLSVRMKGKALSDGAAGDVIRVKNSTSNRVVEGVVTAMGVVKVKM